MCSTPCFNALADSFTVMNCSASEDRWYKLLSLLSYISYFHYTAEGRQFINGNSHHPQATFKSILFGEAIRLRRLNQRKDDHLNSLNRLKEKAIRSKFPLNMTNDMIALSSNWEDRLRPQICDNKDWQWQGPDGLVAALFRKPRHYKQATSARGIHSYFCRTTKLSLTGYLWK